ncbi:hypothetical protein KP509_08G068400 [Ceratopteris richardii]|uniref:Uncharacterized protein n=1 Tax=Ceratopteris richardii TaxID=49495 RepID=A0A8T2UDF4_CERRI|nr:hypothetical protein KP509_08G068400 [Ceratopteris richardii]
MGAWFPRKSIQYLEMQSGKSTVLKKKRSTDSHPSSPSIHPLWCTLPRNLASTNLPLLFTVTQEEIDEAKQLLASVFMSNETDLTPTEKYELPQTASQEYGWCSRPFMEPDPFFNFPHKGCAITKFAAAYQECMHRSPYARRNPVDQHVAKSGVDYAHTGVNTSRIGSPSVTSSAQASSINARGKSYSKVPPDSSLPQVQESAVKEESVPAAA